MCDCLPTTNPASGFSLPTPQWMFPSFVTCFSLLFLETSDMIQTELKISFNDEKSCRLGTVRFLYHTVSEPVMKISDPDKHVTTQFQLVLFHNYLQLGFINIGSLAV